MTTKTILGAGALALAVAGSAPAFGHRMGGDRACGGGMSLGGGRVLHALGLSADQQQKVQDILAAHRPKLRHLAANEKAAAQAVADKLLGTGAVTQQDLDAALQLAAQSLADLMHVRPATSIAVRQLPISRQITLA